MMLKLRSAGLYSNALHAQVEWWNEATIGFLTAD